MPSTTSAPQPKAEEKTLWGDEEERDDLPQETIDSNGVKTITEYKTNDKGQKVKIIKKIKVVKTVTKRNKNVEERKKWKKFGECAGLPPGREQGITYEGDEVTLALGGPQQKEEKSTSSAVPANVVCRTCNKTGDHYTLKCPYKQQLADRGVTQEAQAAASEETTTPSVGKYVIPKNRGGAGDDDTSGRRDEGATVRVTNLSEDTKESDLQELFRPFGPISRVYLAKDKVTNLSRGFAFINFVHREDAAKAIEKLSGFGYDHLILHLEWAKPSK